MLEMVQHVGQIIQIDMKAERSWEDNAERWNVGTDIWEAKAHWKNMNWLEKKNRKSGVYNTLKNQRSDFSDLLR